MQRDYPFGSPDGSRTDIKDLISNFVAFPPDEFGPGLGMSEESSRIRVVVGAKGSGKTVYLRRLQASASANEATHADIIQQDFPTTANVVKFCQAMPPEQVTERWSQLWHRAIIRSTVSHVLHDSRLTSQSVRAEDLEVFSGSLFPEFEAPCSIYSQVTQIINQYHTEHQFHSYLEHERWPALEHRLSQVISDLPPIYFFVDAVDEEYAHAPMYWLQCQKGLFYRVMRLVRDAHFGGRLHVIICVREHVLASVLQSEHATRYEDEPKVQRLNWDAHAISFLLDAKIDRLPPDLVMNHENKSDSLSRWLGQETIENISRGITEDLSRYLFRHTRLLPRDIVIFGNALSAEVLRAKSAGDTCLDPAVIRRVVAQKCATFGNEQLTIAANHIAADLMPRSAGRMDFTDFYTQHDAYRNQVLERLRKLIAIIAHDRFSADILHTVINSGKDLFEGYSEACSVLWQTGLLGYREHGVEKDRFFSLEGAANFALPLDKGEYVLHSCLIDSAGVLPMPSGPPVYV